MNEVKLKPVSGRGVSGKNTLVGRSDEQHVDSATSKPLVNGVASKPLPVFGGSNVNGGIGGGVGKIRGTNATFSKPSTSPKTSRISNLMKQFETKGGGAGGGESEGSGGSSASLSGPSPLTSPSHNLSLSTIKPKLDVSPLSGRKMNRKDSVDDLTKKYGGKLRSPSPDSKPYLPPKPSSRCLFVVCAPHRVK